MICDPIVIARGQYFPPWTEANNLATLSGQQIILGLCIRAVCNLPATTPDVQLLRHLHDQDIADVEARAWQHLGKTAALSKNPRTLARDIDHITVSDDDIERHLTEWVAVQEEVGA